MCLEVWLIAQLVGCLLSYHTWWPAVMSWHVHLNCCMMCFAMICSSVKGRLYLSEIAFQAELDVFQIPELIKF